MNNNKMLYNLMVSSCLKMAAVTLAIMLEEKRKNQGPIGVWQGQSLY